MKTKTIILSIAERVRKLQYRLHRTSLDGILSPGIPCYVEDPTADQTHGDVIHPCVRYIEQGFQGHHWWMVYTPLYAWNDELENPRLCYADAPEGELPTHWHFHCHISHRPPKGYNSDPTILYHDGRLYVYWRESFTPRTDKLHCTYATVGCYVTGTTVTFLPDAMIVEDQVRSDREICPTFIGQGSTVRAYTLHQRYEPPFIHRLPNPLISLYFALVRLADVCRLHSWVKCQGVALWEAPTPSAAFRHVATTPFRGGSTLYQPWHMDIFKSGGDDDEDGDLYAIVQSNEKYADICLARSTDGRSFTLASRPLLTSYATGQRSLYKPTAQVVRGQFYLFYTAQAPGNPQLHQLYALKEEFRTFSCLFGK